MRFVYFSRIRVSGLNPDNLMLSGSLETGQPTPEMEVYRALFSCGLSTGEVKKAVRGGYEASFDGTISKQWIDE